MRNIRIYQTGHHEFRFMNYDYFMEQAGFVDVDSFSYKEVYKAHFDLSNEDMIACEQVFVLLNTHHPENYQAWSLSVSDIISLDGKLYFVDSVGFVLLDQNTTAVKVFAKCLLRLKNDHYFKEILDMLDEVSAEPHELDLADCSVSTELNYDSSHGLTIKIGVTKLGENTSIATLYTSEMSKKAFSLMGELCGALAYHLSQYVESFATISRAA